MTDSLLRRIESRTARITVVGLGYVGLPTALAFAEVGFHVTGVDSDIKRIRLLRAKVSYLKETGVSELLQSQITKGFFSPNDDVLHALSASHVVVVCVQTPLARRGVPNTTFLKRVARSLGHDSPKGKLIIVESTVSPGTVEGTFLKGLQDCSGLICGKDFWLAYCPERVFPGRSMQELRSNPRIVAGFDEKSSLLAKELLRHITSGEIIISNIRAAEIAKLAENTFRDVNIAFANELALICEERKVDVMEVIRLANTHPRVRSIHRPGYGVGGPCLPKDPYLLLWPSKAKRVSLIRTSREMNDSMPLHSVEIIERALRDDGKSLSDAKIGVLGVTYKGGIDDVRDTPAESLIRSLLKRRAKVKVYDPKTRCTFGAKRARTLQESISDVDCVAVLADHKEITDSLVACLESVDKHPILFDGIRIFDPKVVRSVGSRYIAVGYQDINSP